MAPLYTCPGCNTVSAHRSTRMRHANNPAICQGMFFILLLFILAPCEYMNVISLHFILALWIGPTYMYFVAFYSCALWIHVFRCILFLPCEYMHVFCCILFLVVMYIFFKLRRIARKRTHWRVRLVATAVRHSPPAITWPSILKVSTTIWYPRKRHDSVKAWLLSK